MTITAPNLEQPHELNATNPFKFLTLPYDIRLIIYTHLFQNSITTINHKSRSEYETSTNSGLHKLSLPPVYNIILTNHLCHQEAYLLFHSLTSYQYQSTFVTRRITTICSTQTATYVRRIFDISHLYFEDFRDMNHFFPRLEVLGIVGHDVTSHILQEREFPNLSYDYFTRHLPKSSNQVELLKWLEKGARFRTFISTSVTVTYFGDNSRDFERVVPVILDVKNRRIIPGGERREQRHGLLYELLESGKLEP